jgi:membrane-associated phospholipid phosphatase
MTRPTRKRGGVQPKARAARIITEATSPAVLIVVQVALAAWISTPDLGRAALYGGLAIMFASVVPMAFVVFGAAIGRWANHHIPVRRHRLLPMCAAFGSLVLGAGLLHLLDGPWYVIKILIINAAGLAVLTIVTAWWLVSAHTAMAAATVTLLPFMLGAPAAILLPLPAVTAWSRLHLGAHTPAQIAVGAAIGVGIAGGLQVRGVRHRGVRQRVVRHRGVRHRGLRFGRRGRGG